MSIGLNFVGLGLITGFGDVNNMIWKLAAIERGLANHHFLDTYTMETRTAAIANTQQSRLNEGKIWKTSSSSRSHYGLGSVHGGSLFDTA